MIFLIYNSIVKWSRGDLYLDSPNKGRVGYAMFFIKKKMKIAYVSLDQFSSLWVLVLAGNIL